MLDKDKSFERSINKRQIATIDDSHINQYNRYDIVLVVL